MKNKKALSEAEMDELVIAGAEDESAWEAFRKVVRKRKTSLALSSELAARAAFLAKLHRAATAEEWLRQVIEERIEFEEAAFSGLKRDLAVKTAR
ncbi:MAG: hypothetical protein AAB401_07305 [Acidobacteriota bacterium]